MAVTVVSFKQIYDLDIPDNYAVWPEWYRYEIEKDEHDTTFLGHAIYAVRRRGIHVILQKHTPDMFPMKMNDRYGWKDPVTMVDLRLPTIDEALMKAEELRDNLPSIITLEVL